VSRIVPTARLRTSWRLSVGKPPQYGRVCSDDVTAADASVLYHPPRNGTQYLGLAAPVGLHPELGDRPPHGVVDPLRPGDLIGVRQRWPTLGNHGDLLEGLRRCRDDFGATRATCQFYNLPDGAAGRRGLLQGFGEEVIARL
jgi:hypothetical protein